MSEQTIVIVDQNPGPAAAKSPGKGRKPSSEWKKTTRMKEVKRLEPDFVGKFELAKHLCCHIGSLRKWIEEGTIPPPWFWPGQKHPVWLRKHYDFLKENREWPREAWWNPEG